MMLACGDLCRLIQSAVASLTNHLLSAMDPANWPDPKRSHHRPASPLRAVVSVTDTATEGGPRTHHPLPYNPIDNEPVHDM